MLYLSGVADVDRLALLARCWLARYGRSRGGSWRMTIPPDRDREAIALGLHDAYCDEEDCNTDVDHSERWLRFADVALGSLGNRSAGSPRVIGPGVHYGGAVSVIRGRYRIEVLDA